MMRKLIVLVFVCTTLLAPTHLSGQREPGTNRLRILVTNDDGYQAPGLLALVDSLHRFADVTVVAPQEQQSGTGHGISFRDPIEVTEVGNGYGIQWYAVNARPATVVRVALHSLLDSVPDLVVSGINTGDNIGMNAWVSGTVAAAREGVFAGIPALAFSVNPNGSDPYGLSAGWARRVIDQLISDDLLSKPLLLNVNLQAEEPLGVRVVPMSLAMGAQSYDEFVSPSGQTYLFHEWSAPKDDSAEGTDLYWHSRRYITVTPLRVDLTDTDALRSLGAIFNRH